MKQHACSKIARNLNCYETFKMFLKGQIEGVKDGKMGFVSLGLVITNKNKVGKPKSCLLQKIFIPTPLKVIVILRGRGVSAVKLDKGNYKAKIEI